jgi:hypothetical protein
MLSEEFQNEYRIMDCTGVARRYVFAIRQHEDVSTSQGT